MTESNAEALTVTDAQVDSFFESEGQTLDAPQEKEPAALPEPAVKETKESTAADADKKDDKDPKAENKVNYGALHEERMRRKEAAERAKKAEERAALLEEQLKRYAQSQQEPTYDEDPLEVVRRENKQIKDVLIAQANKALQESEEQRYWDKVTQSELAFKQDKPDFDDATKFLAENRINELKKIGWSDQEAAKVLADEVRWITDKAYADEVNPAERFYELALLRGFTPAESTKIAENAVINDKLDRIEKGMKSNRALPPASKSIKQDLTAEDLADMNIDALSNLRGETDFDKAWNKLFGN
jgi:hypothetical protein